MKCFYLLVALVVALLFSACTQTASSDDDSSSKTLTEIYFPKLDRITDGYEAELYFNYVMIDLYYLYGHSRNEIADDYKVYLGKGTDADERGKGYCTVPYYDVCYMYNQLKDPFTRYFDPYVAQRVLTNLQETQTIVGIGAEVEEILKDSVQYLQVSNIYPESPSEKAGLREGDIILQVDGVHISSQSNFETMCTGNKGDVIKIVVERGTDTIVVANILDEYRTPTVRIHYEDSIPVILITEFTGTTISEGGSYAEFVAALQKTEGAKSTIIDLRKNPGGSTDQCNSISSEFLSAGDTIISDIYTKSVRETSDGNDRYVQAFDTVTYTATRDGLGKDRYYVFLADTGSASCAEVVLSAVTVNKKSPVVGMLTYGKGIGQNYIVSGFTQNDPQGLARIPAAEGYDKNWESYHDLGIVPDYEIDDPDEQMAKAVELAKKASEKRTAGYGTKRLYHFSKMGPQEQENRIPTLKDLKPRFSKAKLF